jgi:FG-GAP-like repeat
VKKFLGLILGLMMAAGIGACRSTAPASGSTAGSEKENKQKPPAKTETEEEKLKAEIAAENARLAEQPPKLSRVDPNVIEETDTYIIERYPKKDYIKVDASHIRHPLMPGVKVEFFKEDENYYYVKTPKYSRNEAEAMVRKSEEKKHEKKVEWLAQYGLKPSDFRSIEPPRTQASFRLATVSDPGLPHGGMWRANFTVADMNGDGIPDIVSPPARIGGPVPHIFLGDGKGHFKPWPLTIEKDGKPYRKPFDYGGTAVADFNKDGVPDFAIACHGGTIHVLLARGNGVFELDDAGLPEKLSSQAVAASDLDGDGYPDLAVTMDQATDPHGPDFKRQVRVYRNLGGKGWSEVPGAIDGGLYSQTIALFDLDGDGKPDLLTGSHYSGGVNLFWRGKGNGSFEKLYMDNAVEGLSYHFAIAPGVLTSHHLPAMAVTVNTFGINGEAMEEIDVYYNDHGAWKRAEVWREPGYTSGLYALGFGDLDGDGLPDIVFPDDVAHQLRIFLQQPDGSFREAPFENEPSIDSPGACVRIVDIDGDGRKDIILSQTSTERDKGSVGGFRVFLNRPR